MSLFDEKCLMIFESINHEENDEHPIIWDNISNSETFKKKLSAISELGVILCDSVFDWKEEEKLLKEENILVPELKNLLESFMQAKKLSELEPIIVELISILGLEKSEIEVAEALHSILVTKDVTPYHKPSDLFLISGNSKSMIQSLSVFPFFCMNRDKSIKVCKDMVHESFSTEFHELISSMNQLDCFGGFLNEYSNNNFETDDEETIGFISKSKYFMLTFIEEVDLSDGDTNFLKSIVQMKLILSQLSRSSIVKDIYNFHNSICGHALLTSKERVIVLTMKPHLYYITVNNENVIRSDYFLYLSGVYNLSSTNDRIELCKFLLISANMALQISKRICIYLMEQDNKESENSNNSNTRQENKSLSIGDILYCKNDMFNDDIDKGYVVIIEKELDNIEDKPMYEGAIVNTDQRCIVKIYNNIACNNYRTPITLNSQGFYVNGSLIPFTRADVTLKGIPLPDFVQNHTHDKKLLMAQLLIQLYKFHKRSTVRLGWIHNDIKPENIIVYDNYPYFIDFEASKTFDNYDITNEQCFDNGRDLTSSSGTCYFNPPEKKSKLKSITPKSDIYSLGLVFIEILSPKSAFSSLESLTNDPKIIELITRMTQNDIKDRPLAEDCLKILEITENEYRQYAPSTISKDYMVSSESYEQMLKKRSFNLFAKNSKVALEEFKKNPNPYDAAFLISKTKNVDESFQIYDIAKNNNQINLQVIVELILSCSVNSNIERACELWDVLFELLQKEKNFKLSPFALKTFIFGLCKSGRVVLALTILKQQSSPIVLNPKLLTLMLNSCVESNLITESIELFRSMESKYGVTPNEVHYNTIIKSFVQQSRLDEAIEMLLEMENEGFQPNNFTYTILLSGCTDISIGKKLHKIVINNSMIDQDVQLSSSLVVMYCKCGDTISAREIFDELVIAGTANVVTFGSMINGYGKSGMTTEALLLFDKMQECGVEPDTHIIEIVLNICAENGLTKYALELFHSIESKYGLTKNEISYSCVIKGLVKQSRLDEAMEMLQEMENDGIQPNDITFTILLSGCADATSFNIGKELHKKISNSTNVFQTTTLMTSLINMYCKCGDMTTAREIFDKLVIAGTANIKTWGSMINGYGQSGMTTEALLLFEKMQQYGVKPDSSLITMVLNACSHGGLLSEALQLYSSMKLKFDLKPEPAHITSITDLLSRSGHLDDAENLIQQSSFSNDVANWRALLGGCRKFNDIVRAERVFNKIIELDPKDATSYMLLNNIYSATNQVEKLNHLREQMVKKNIKKIPGKSIVEVNGKVYTFYVDDKTHPEIDLINKEVKRLNDEIIDAGYKPDTKWVTSDIQGEEERKDILCKHSERLAITYSLINTPAETPILINNNIRLCGDCHEAIKFISKVKKRSITVRDANRFHHFKDGVCSCGDFW